MSAGTFQSRTKGVGLQPVIPSPAFCVAGCLVSLTLANWTVGVPPNQCDNQKKSRKFQKCPLGGATVQGKNLSRALGLVSFLGPSTPRHRGIYGFCCVWHVFGGM